jgi:hypothetical protein
LGVGARSGETRLDPGCRAEDVAFVEADRGLVGFRVQIGEEFDLDDGPWRRPLWWSSARSIGVRDELGASQRLLETPRMHGGGQ